MIAVFYGGELVWRERDRKLNEIIDSTPVQSWIMTVPKIVAIFVVLLVVNVAAMATGLFYQLVNGAAEFGVWNYVGLVHHPGGDRRAADRRAFGDRAGPQPQQICRLGDRLRLVRRDDLPQQHGLFQPALHLRRLSQRPAERFCRARAASGRAPRSLRLYWALFAIILAVIAHVLWPRGTDVGLRVRLKRMRHRLAGLPLALIGVAAAGMAATGAYAYYNIKVLNSYQTSDEAEKYNGGLRAQISQI